MFFAEKTVGQELPGVAVIRLYHKAEIAEWYSIAAMV